MFNIILFSVLFVVIIIQLISYTTTSWNTIKYGKDNVSLGIWKTCDTHYSKCIDINSEDMKPYISIIRILFLVAIVLSISSLYCITTKDYSTMKILLGISSIIEIICLIIWLSVVLPKQKLNLSDGKNQNKVTYGYSFYLYVISLVLLISLIMCPTNNYFL